jgi:hypothetical protein
MYLLSVLQVALREGCSNKLTACNGGGQKRHQNFGALFLPCISVMQKVIQPSQTEGASGCPAQS